MKALKTEVYDTIAKYNGIELPELKEAEVRDLCAALRELAEWHADSLKAYEEEIVPALKSATEELKEQHKKAQEIAEYWQKEWSSAYGKLNDLKAQLTALSTIITAITK